jgi:hypothetical protein
MNAGNLAFWMGIRPILWLNILGWNPYQYVYRNMKQQKMVAFDSGLPDTGQTVQLLPQNQAA